MDDLKEEFCKRKIYKSKYESNNNAVSDWWESLFQMLEEDANISQDKRLSILKEILPNEILQKLISAISVLEEKFQDSEEEESTSTILSESTINSRVSLVDTESEEPEPSVSEFERNLGIVSQKKNLYLEFFKRKPDRAAIWRDLPPIEWKEMRLSEMAEAITNSIATDFVKWLETMGGSVGESLNVESIKEMFHVGTQSHCAGTVSVELKELATVTQRTAESVGKIELSKPHFLRDQIRKDQKASNREPKITAFGTRLPAFMQIRPPPKDLYKKWLRCEHIPKRLETMAAVWEGITHLRSTRTFCEFLHKEHHNVKPPKYLVEAGLMNPKVFSRHLTQTEELALELGDKNKAMSMQSEKPVKPLFKK